MRYSDAIAELFVLKARGIRLGASRMQQALALRGHPERSGRFVHVAGTNGKGSVSAMIAACLREQGYKTGLYISPHIHRWVERIQIDGRPITEREATRRITEALRTFSAQGAPELTFFELTTLMAFEAFRDHQCDVAVLEVGLGGRLDATNAVPTAVSIITRIAFDHTSVLGDSLSAIAGEKAGILRSETPAVIGVRDPEALRTIDAEIKRLGVDAWYIGQDFAAELDERAGIRVRAGKRVLSGLRPGLRGAHQLENVACAVAALERLRAQDLVVNEPAMRRGLARVRWPARLEALAGRPRVLLDAAHNEDGCTALARYLASEDPFCKARTRGRRVLVFGALADKGYRAMLATLAPLFDRVIVCKAPVERAVSVAQLTRAVRMMRVPCSQARSVAEALARGRRSAGPKGELVVAGSIFLVAQARAKLLGVREDPAIRM